MCLYASAHIWNSSAMMRYVSLMSLFSVPSDPLSGALSDPLFGAPSEPPTWLEPLQKDNPWERTASTPLAEGCRERPCKRSSQVLFFLSLCEKAPLQPWKMQRGWEGGRRIWIWVQTQKGKPHPQVLHPATWLQSYCPFGHMASSLQWKCKSSPTWPHLMVAAILKLQLLEQLGILESSQEIATGLW